MKGWAVEQRASLPWGAAARGFGEGRRVDPWEVGSRGKMRRERVS